MLTELWRRTSFICFLHHLILTLMFREKKPKELKCFLKCWWSLHLQVQKTSAKNFRKVLRREKRVKFGTDFISQTLPTSTLRKKKAEKLNAKENNSRIIKWVKYTTKWWKNEFVFFVEKWHQWRISFHSLISSSFFCLFFFLWKRAFIRRRKKRRKKSSDDDTEKRKDGVEWKPKGKLKKLQFEIHMANKFYGKLYCGRSWIVRGETHFLIPPAFLYFGRLRRKERKEIYAIFKILFILKCASNVAHFFSFRLLSIRQMESKLALCRERGNIDVEFREIGKFSNLVFRNSQFMRETF